MTKRKMADALRAAAALVRVRLAKGEFAVDANGERVPVQSEAAAAFCARGALKRVLGCDEGGWYEHDIQREVESDLGIGQFHPDQPFQPEDAVCLASWNNAEERTGDEVADAFLKTAARLGGGK